jgi:dTDP-4-dehydrorhamnose reductase
MISPKDFIKKRILIVGSNGMLGQRLTEYYLTKDEVELFACSAEDESFIPGVDFRKIDITNKEEVKKIINDFYPDVIINTAAYTNVDGCESNKELAWGVNVTGVANLAHYAWTCDAHMIHISSDYVFDGENGPYTENDRVHPISYYGRTKLASENTLRGSGVFGTIIRTNVLYGPAKYGRPDFVKWVVNSIREGKTIRIVTDQINNPTYIDDLVFAISKIVDYKKDGLYHIGGKEFLSRFDFTLKIADFFDLDKNLIVPIKTEELNQAAKRPLKSGLITLKAESELGYSPRETEETFQLMKTELKL